jgi:structural maintenance of chromosome 1
VRDLEKRMNTLEDDVFAEFCVEIGVENIRQYEAQEMSERQERDRKLLEFVKQISKLKEQLTYQQSRLQQSAG